MRGAQLTRQWKIFRLIEYRMIDVIGHELALEREVPLRSVYRDLKAIQDAGVPLYTERDSRSSVWKSL